MGGDLREELLKAGLISKQQARKAAHSERVEKKRADPGSKAQQAQAARDEAARAQREQAQRDRTLAEARQAAARERDAQAQQRQRREMALRRAVQDGALPKWGGGRTYYFQDGTRVEALQLNDEAARRMEDGNAAVVRAGEARGSYALITSGAAAKLLDAAPDAIVCWHRR